MESDSAAQQGCKDAMDARMQGCDGARDAGERQARGSGTRRLLGDGKQQSRRETKTYLVQHDAENRDQLRYWQIERVHIRCVKKVSWFKVSRGFMISPDTACRPVVTAGATAERCAVAVLQGVSRN